MSCHYVGIEPHDAVVGDEADGFVVVFAKIKLDVRERLRQLDGVPKLFGTLARVRSDRLASFGVDRRVGKSESLMDLLVAALPHTTRTVGYSSPRDIVDRAIAAELRHHGMQSSKRSSASLAARPDAATSNC